VLGVVVRKRLRTNRSRYTAISAAAACSRARRMPSRSISHSASRKPGGIEDPQRDTVEHEALLDDIARRSGDVGDDGAVADRAAR
jgi:hypothetical protein